MAFGSRRRTSQTSAHFPVLDVRELAEATVAAQIGVGPMRRWTAIHIDLEHESQRGERTAHHDSSGTGQRPFEFWQQGEACRVVKRAISGVKQTRRSPSVSRRLWAGAASRYLAVRGAGRLSVITQAPCRFAVSG
jgi:hypothetical protein